MNANAAEVRAELFWSHIDRLIEPSPETISRLYDARAAANDRTVLTQAEYDALILLAEKVGRRGSWC
jgi:hypothetical protein